MIRAVRFAASHNLIIEPATWEILRGLAPTITRAAPARLYEEMLKLFLLGSARPLFALLEDSGLLAALFPGLAQWLGGNDHHRIWLLTNLECLDRLRRGGLPPSPPLFLSALFGPRLEEDALARHRDGVPYMQALDGACAEFMAELCRTVSVPGRIGSQLRRILAVQPSLHRMPPRRPSSLAGRPEFEDAMAYLCVTAKTREEDRAVLEWWQAFIQAPPAAPLEPVADPVPAKRRRKRRRRRRPSTPTAAGPLKSDS
jgi:poly(A) polymerase